MGIDTGRAAALVSFISGCLAGAGGVLIGLNFNAIHPYMGETMMLRGFVVIIVGGMGDLRGAVIAGLAGLAVGSALAGGYGGYGGYYGGYYGAPYYPAYYGYYGPRYGYGHYRRPYGYYGYRY